jgi:hypothetical protein
MDSQVHYTSEIGKMHLEEARSRAARHRLEQATKRRTRLDAPLSRMSVMIYRRALRIAALPLLLHAGDTRQETKTPKTVKIPDSFEEEVVIPLEHVEEASSPKT